MTIHKTVLAWSCLLVGSLIGFGGGVWFSSPSREVRTPAPTPTGQPDILRAMAELQQALRECTRLLNGQTELRAPDRTRQPVEEGATSEQLASSIGELSRLLQEEVHRAGMRNDAGRLIPFSNTGPGYASLDGLRAALHSWSLDENGGDIGDELTRAHVFWTAEDVVSRYGVPLRLGHRLGMELWYEGLQLGDEWCDFRFSIHYGYVSAVSYDCLRRR